MNLGNWAICIIEFVLVELGAQNSIYELSINLV